MGDDIGKGVLDLYIWEPGPLQDEFEGAILAASLTASKVVLM